MKLFLTVLCLGILSINLVFGQKQNAVDSLLSCLETVTDDTTRIDILNSISKEIIRSNPTKSKQYALEALSIAEKTSNNKGTLTSLILIGFSNIDLGNYTSAEKVLKRAIQIANKLNDKKNVSICLLNMGLIYYYKSDYEKAMTFLEKTEKKAKEIKAEEIVSQGLNLVGNIFADRSDFNNAIKYYNESLEIEKKLGNKMREAGQLNNIGTIFYEKGDYSKAVSYFFQSLKLFDELGSKKGTSSCLTNLGHVHNNKRNYFEAIKYYKQALKIEKELGNKRSISTITTSIGNLYNKQGDFIKALENLNSALQIKEEINDKRGISYCLKVIGKIYYKQENYFDALICYKRALKISQKIGIQGEIVQIYNLLGKVYYKQEKYKEALFFFQKALIYNIPEFNDTIVNKNPHVLNALISPKLHETLSLKAQTFYKIYLKNLSINELKLSILNYDLAFRLIHKMRNDYSGESTRLFLSKDTREYFAGAILAAHKFDQTVLSNNIRSKTFEYIEKSKSATLSAYISDSKMSEFYNISDTLVEKGEIILTNRRKIETSIQKVKAQKGGYDTTLVENYQDKLFDYSRQYDSLIATLKENYPDYYQLKYEQNVANINDVQKQLGEKGALLNYFVGDTTLFIATVTKDTVVYKVVKTDSLFAEKVMDYHIDVKSGISKYDLKTGSVLYRYLIAPIENSIKGKNKLIIIPDEQLYYVPFEALCKTEGHANDLSKAGFLIRQYEVSYHHSATLWLNSKKRPGAILSNKNSFIGFAPVFDPKINNGYMLSNEWLSDTTNIETATRSVSNDLKHFNNLPYSKKEIKAILKLFGKKRKEAKGYFHKQANEENFKQKVAGHQFVHIASHSFTNDTYPALSGIAFSQPDTTLSGNENEDGILYAGESYNINLSKADLVVLSSCKSGLGKLVKGEGFLSLSRGFLYSGAPNIIFSLWNVKDEQTKDLMVEFYKQVLNGKSYATALRKAKLKLLNNSKTAEPRYWAAWMLVGR